ncbi:RNA (uracil-5-)methyltransferase, putative [Hepatocystis sp. ex Piliocolobus tephrosceles]|nr:RNA (uracil-5-)methyltransferase, putative [Hepatocystis sp. ex Piliocolobus tephrosceles]
MHRLILFLIYVVIFYYKNNHPLTFCIIKTKRNHLYIFKKKKVFEKMDNVIEQNNTNILTRDVKNAVINKKNINKNFHLSLDKYSKCINETRTGIKSSGEHVLSIFSFALKYMKEKDLKKWIKLNIKVPICDARVLRRQRQAYIYFKTYEEMKKFKKLIENKRFYQNDSLSNIEIDKSFKYIQERKQSKHSQLKELINNTKVEHIEGNNATNNDEGNNATNNNSSEKHTIIYENKKRKREPLNGRLTHKQTKTNHETLPDFKTIIEINKKEKKKTIENYVTPLYKYNYADQIKIKNTFLEKCKNKILSNLKEKYQKQNLLFSNEISGDIFSNSNTTNNNSSNKKDTSLRSSNNNNITLTAVNNDSTNLSNDNESNIKQENNNESLLDKQIKQYELKLDAPLYPDEQHVSGYRNKCEFTIAYDENNNMEIGFVVGKLKNNVNETSDYTNCNFSENNISNNPSPINESHQTILRNKKLQQAYYLNPIVEKVDTCIHIHPCMKQAINKIKDIIKSSPYPVFDRVYKTGVWRLVIIRFNREKELMITLQTYALDQKKKKDIKRLLINKLSKKEDETCMSFNGFKVVSLYLQEHHNSTDSSIESPNEHLWGKEFIEDTILNNKFLLSPSCFFQVNHVGCDLLYKRVIDYIQIDTNKTNYIFDLCCGSGTIGICAANELKNNVNIIGIEVCKDSIISANKSAELNKIKNYKFINGKVEEVFSDEIKNINNKNSNIIVIVDPPRSGLANTIINILSTNELISQIIYVSCNPASLVNNVTNLLFQNEKLKIKNMVFVDMFPHTFHLECITNITKSE